MIGILDYGAGNVLAIKRIYDNLKIQNKLVKSEGDFIDVSKLILPGVGSFDSVMSKLTSSGLVDELNRCVLTKQIPVLGICVGLQVMANRSEEGKIPGLGWIEADVKRFELGPEFYVPHMGWNSVDVHGDGELFEGVDLSRGFYFVHSFHFDLRETVDSYTTTSYGMNFVSSIQKGNIYASQFHPEKSHSNGVRLLQNFASL